MNWRWRSTSLKIQRARVEISHQNLHSRHESGLSLTINHPIHKHTLDLVIEGFPLLISVLPEEMINPASISFLKQQNNILLQFILQQLLQAILPQPF